MIAQRKLKTCLLNASKNGFMGNYELFQKLNAIIKRANVTNYYDH